MKLFFNMNKKSLPQVVKQNESDIKELQEKIKPYYTTSVDLNKDSAVVDVSDTNIDESTFVNGYLLTENGKLFNIVSVDDGIAYISFMADFKGAKGDTGLAGGELTSFYFNPNNMEITYNDGKLNIIGQLTFTTASGGQTEQSTIGATIIVPIEGSDDIVVDANEQGNGASIHLDNDIVTQIQSSVKNSQMLRNLIVDSTTIVSAIDGQGKLVFYVDASITNKLAKALVTPMSAPSEDEFVLIDSNNAQILESVSQVQSRLNNLTKPNNGQTISNKQAVVVESYLSSDGNTWYRKYSDGFIITGTRVIGYVNTANTITLPISFTNAKFQYVAVASGDKNVWVYNNNSSLNQLSYKMDNVGGGSTDEYVNILAYGY